VGNHEFDVGLDTLARRIGEANFPFLSANTRWRDTHAVPTDIGLQPFTVVEVNSLRVGIIGLTTTSTPRTTNPVNVTELEFIDYEQAIRQTVPAVRSQGVDMLFVIAHVCMAPVHQLAQSLSDLNIQLIGGGHCNELEAEKVQDTLVLGGGSHLVSYAKAVFHYDVRRKRLNSVDYSVHQNIAGQATPTISAIIENWQEQVASSMSVVIGYNGTELARRDVLLETLFIQSWLLADPTADVAFSNAGGLRDALPAGAISVGTIVGMLPFDNTIFAVYLSGAEIRQVLSQGTRPLVAGLQRQGDDWIEAGSGAPLQDDRRYRVLVNSFMYAGGDNYQGIAQFDPEGFDTGINYRQPFLDWIRRQDSNRLNPLQFDLAR